MTEWYGDRGRKIDESIQGPYKEAKQALGMEAVTMPNEIQERKLLAYYCEPGEYIDERGEIKGQSVNECKLKLPGVVQNEGL